jgi:hypothetical protein
MVTPHVFDRRVDLPTYPIGLTLGPAPRAGNLGRDGPTSGHAHATAKAKSERAATISAAAWRRARQAFGPPLAIRVLDDPTARRVRAVVPARVTVTVTPDDQRLHDMTDACEDDDDLDAPLRRALF